VALSRQEGRRHRPDQQVKAYSSRTAASTRWKFGSIWAGSAAIRRPAPRSSAIWGAATAALITNNRARSPGCGYGLQSGGCP